MSTQKNKSKTKTDIWKLFDTVNEEDKLECIYSNEEIDNNCKECESPLCISEEGFYCCSNTKCGIIYKDVLDFGAEWRYYGADDTNSSDPTRCGMPVNPLLKESSFGCKITCNGHSSYEMRKIRRYTEWQSMPYIEKSQYDEFQRITILAQNAGLPKIIIDEAMRCHKKLSEAKTFRGLNRQGIIAAAIYVACRTNNYPRTAKEIATIFHLDNTSATKGCKNAITLLNEMEFEMENTDKTSLCQTTPLSFIERYCSRLSINSELTNLCKFIAVRIQKNNLIPENTPHSIAAGIVYFVAQTFNLNVSKKQVNTISEISEVTINKCYKKLFNIKNELIPQKLFDKYL